MKGKLLFLATAIILSSGCASTYQQQDLRSAAEALDGSKGVLISKPENGRYAATVYAQSGTMTANAVSAAFSKHAHRVEIIDSCAGEACLEVIDASQYGYYVMPVILHWEDRATEWSGKSDRLEIRIVVYDAASKEEVANSSYTGKSKWMTFGGDHPEDLLPEPTEVFVNSLYE